MKKLFVLLAATMLLAACQTTSIPVSSKQPPRIVTHKSASETQNALINEFKGMGFKVVRRSSKSLVLEQTLTPNSDARKQHASYSDGTPRSQIRFTFSNVQEGTKVTAKFDMLVNPGKSNQERVTLLDSPDGARLQRVLEGVK
ncbi:hypothetical protein [Pseudovibrio sp. Ad26]|uniref:hypothetical protein n=1 Tax=Pseudovibrio sp. Ad26 TaxID=989410 RepID=UPI0007AEAA8C|nr:hypothetical protein [Pseudovibrio sp. Ad26]KZL03158.1 hypothetical protein PsAD26_04679 [Pseudovibrio sp. Ad26]